MKLLYCGYCADIVRLTKTKRYCECGKSWGHYLEDNATTVQTYPSLSLGIANQDLNLAIDTFVENPRYFSPILSIRSWINPLSEPDVKFVPGEHDEDNEDDNEDNENNGDDDETTEDTTNTEAPETNSIP